MYKRIALFGLVLAITLSSCDQESEVAPQDESVTSVEDFTSLGYLVDDTEDLIDATMATRDPGGDCPEITFRNPRGTFPNVVTIDFGDSCVGPRGHVRSGKIVIEQSAPMNEAGAARTVTFENFMIDDIQITGYKVLTNTGSDDDGNVTFTRFAEVTLIFPGGATASWTASHVKTQIAGGDTDDVLDDVFEITGSAQGVNRVGTSFSVDIVLPLIKHRDCRWVSEGMVDMTVEGLNGARTRTLDFGYENGGCDNLAQVTFGNGATKVVHIHRRWW
ncbi:MAG: hypothetical protein R3301_04510 [Saprospiraceae bacterium]|nr:hypothetical protein [Saprospiraceae bacterium]